MYRILITGSRTWDDTEAIKRTIIHYAAKNTEDPKEVMVVHGACPKGADSLADSIATAYGMAVETHPANWNSRTDTESGLKVYDRGAGFARNKKMVELGADLCLAFIKDNSHGATHCAKLAKEAKIPTVIVRA